jgi:hypothetical protein
VNPETGERLNRRFRVIRFEHQRENGKNVFVEFPAIYMAELLKVLENATEKYQEEKEEDKQKLTEGLVGANVNIESL